jgi:hypothetical protein
VFPVNQELYRDIRNLGGPIQFQTASPGIPGGSGLAPTGLLKDWDKAIETAVRYGATAVEVWPSVAFRGKSIINGWNRIDCVAPEQCSAGTAMTWNAAFHACSSKHTDQGVPVTVHSIHCVSWRRYPRNTRPMRCWLIQPRAALFGARENCWVIASIDSGSRGVSGSPGKTTADRFPFASH